MRLHRFYIHQPIDSKELSIEDADLVHQWRTVFRYMVGAQVILFSGDGYDYLCMITNLRNKSAEVEVISKKKNVIPTKNIGLAISLIKKDNMELVVQKATELGVSYIFPIIAERSEKKSLNIERARKIAIEASEQCGRGDVPTIYEPVQLEEFFALPDLVQFTQKILCTPKEEQFNVAAIHSDAVLLAIGPEGGFSDAEISNFSQNDFKRYALGDLILRAETAVIVGLSLITFA